MDATQIAPDELAAFRRFCECAEDNEGHDVPKEMMRRLREAGLVIYVGFGRHQMTDDGAAMRMAE